MRKEHLITAGSEVYLYFEGDFRKHLRKKLRKSNLYFARVSMLVDIGIEEKSNGRRYLIAIINKRIFPKTHPLKGEGIIVANDECHIITKTELEELCSGDEKKIKEFAEISGFNYKTLKKAVEAYLANI